MNWLTRGGVCERKMVEFYGKEGSAKTTLALDVIKNFQIKYPEKYAVYLDAENTLDEDWAREQLGVDMDSVILVKPEEQCAETLLDMVVALVRSGDVGLIIIDSIPFLMPKQAFDNDLEKKTYGGNSALMTTFSSKIIPLINKYDCTIICINQLRDDLGSMFPTYKTPGGRQLKHSYAQRFNLSKSKFIDANGVELTNSCESPAGHIVQVKYEKNKVSKNDRRLTFFTLNYSDGIDELSDTIDLAIQLGTINKNGAWFDYEFGGEQFKFQGKAKLLKHLKEHKDQREFIISETNREALK